MPDRTVEAWRNLWFHTGDAGRLDDAGRLHFVDRIKDCIRRRGENISSYEIEQVLNAHPAVAESAVVGVQVAGAGGEDEVKACLVPAAGAAVDPVALLDWCAPRMPRYAVPRFVEVVAAELDKTATGKIRKRRCARPASPPPPGTASPSATWSAADPERPTGIPVRRRRDRSRAASSTRRGRSSSARSR